MKKAFINWSGGKDCTMALHKILSENKFKPEFLFTTISKEHQRVSMHGVRKELITRQALSLGIHSRKMYLPESNNHGLYEKLMKHEMLLMKERGIGVSVFGDIFLEDLRKYREENLKASGMEAVFPLWKSNTGELVKEFIDLGYKAVIVSIDKRKLDESYLGKELNHELINEFPDNVDPCGENGEFHTFVHTGPIFNAPVKFEPGEKVSRSYTHNNEKFEYGFIDLKAL
jgi:uncharacterized protein (TIGR00290 family)